jgi:hypothetical protein
MFVCSPKWVSPCVMGIAWNGIDAIGGTYVQIKGTKD